MQILNKNKIFIRINKQKALIIDKIETPKYFINKEELTEYDIRNLMVEVGLGNISHNILNELPIKDSKGNNLIFNSNGRLANSPFGFGISSQLALKLLSINR